VIEPDPSEAAPVVPAPHAPRTVARMGIADVFRLVAGAGAAHGIVAAATPLLTRIYSPDQFGQFQIYATTFAFLLVVAAWRYELAVLLPKDEDDGAAVVVLALAVVGLNAVLVAAGAGVLRSLGLVDPRLAPLQTYGWVLPFAIAGGGATAVLTQWCLRVNAVRAVSLARVTQSVGIVGVQLSGAVLPMGGAGLVIGDAIGRIAGSVHLARQAWRMHAAAFRGVRRSTMTALAWEYWRFPVISSGSALINTAGFVLPTVFLSAFGDAPLGWFALVDRVVGAPSSLVGLAVSQVYAANAARLMREDPRALRAMFLQLLGRLALIGVVPFACLGIAGPWLFTIVFGDAWRPAGEYAMSLAIMQYVGFVTWPLIPTLNLLERQDWQLAWDVGRFVLCGAAMGLTAHYVGTPLAVVMAYSASMLVGYCAHALLSYIAINRRVLEMR
jgi:O-antigen/teichoic acid export membrane protein